MLIFPYPPRTLHHCHNKVNVTITFFFLWQALVIVKKNNKNIKFPAELSPYWVFIDGIVKEQDAETKYSHQKCMERRHCPENKNQNTHSYHYLLPDKDPDQSKKKKTEHLHSYLFIECARELLLWEMEWNFLHSQWIEREKKSFDTDLHRFWPIRQRD